MKSILPATAVVVALLWAGSAEARTFRSRQIPNAHECDACHVFPGGPRTPLGIQIQDTLVGGNASWRRVYNLDADGDGFTNGEEMGDAFGDWVSGQASPMELSNPNEAFSVPTPVGTAPISSDVSIELLEDEIFEGVLSIVDPDDDILRPRLVERPANGDFDVAGMSGEFTYTPEAGWSGEDRFTWLVFDGSNLSEVAEVSITVIEVNDLPLFDPPLETDILIREDSSLSFEVSASDEEDGALDIEHSTLPEGARFDAGAGLFLWVPGPGTAGRYELEFSAADSAGQRVSETVVIEIERVNHAPEVTLLGPGAGVEGDTLTWTVGGEDIDGDPLVFEWAFDDEPVETVDALTEITRTFGQDGDFSLRVTISDGIDEVSRRITVRIENVLPVVDAGEDVEIELGEAVSFEGAFVDPGDAGEHVLEWDFGDGSDPVAGAASVAHTYDQSGVFIAVFRVSDDGGQSADGVRVQVGGEGGAEPDPMPDVGPGMMCMQGERVACLGERGCIGGAICGVDGELGACVCGGDGGGGGGGGGGCSAAPARGVGGAVWGVLMVLGLFFVRRRTF